MVLEINKQFHIVNKYIVDFLTAVDIPDDIKQQLLTEWKQRTVKLKGVLHKSSCSAPKRVVSKYLYFCADERPKILAENPGMNIKLVTCELGRRWRQFQDNPDVDRMNKYTTLFENDKARYDAARAENDTSKPSKKPMSAYLMFCAEQRKTRPRISMKELSVAWAAAKLGAEISV